MARKEGSLGGEMRMGVKEHCTTKSNKTVRSDPRGALIQWRDALSGI